MLYKNRRNKESIAYGYRKQALKETEAKQWIQLGRRSIQAAKQRCTSKQKTANGTELQMMFRKQILKTTQKKSCLQVGYYMHEQASETL